MIIISSSSLTISWVMRSKIWIAGFSDKPSILTFPCWSCVFLWIPNKLTFWHVSSTYIILPFFIPTHQKRVSIEILNFFYFNMVKLLNQFTVKRKYAAQPSFQWFFSVSSNSHVFCKLFQIVIHFVWFALGVSCLTTTGSVFHYKSYCIIG